MNRDAIFQNLLKTGKVRVPAPIRELDFGFSEKVKIICNIHRIEFREIDEPMRREFQLTATPFSFLIFDKATNCFVGIPKEGGFVTKILSDQAFGL